MSAGVVDTGICFNWTDTFNGTNGGITVTNTNQPVDAGSATGTITVTSYNGTSPASSFPTLLFGTQVSVTVSGQVYNRVSQTFSDTITITNISDSTITGPFEVGLDSLTKGEALVNATGNFGGWPYITFPGVNSLDPGQSATVTVQFSIGPVAVIKFVPMIYSGSIE